jgi:hypothetical protein
MDRRWLSSILELRSFKGDDCDTDHCVVVEKVWEGLAVSKQATHKFDVERYNLRKRSELEVRKQYRIKISKRFVTLQNLNNSEDVNGAWEILKRIAV